jgi:hypothetical protein
MTRERVRPSFRKLARMVRMTLALITVSFTCAMFGRKSMGCAPDKLIPAIGDNINGLSGGLHVEKVAAELDEEKVEEDDHQSACGRFTEDLWMEALLQSRVQCTQKDVGY